MDNIKLLLYLFKDCIFFSKMYGPLLVEVETGKKENRSAGMDVMTMSQFLERYQKNNIYMVQDVLPEMMGVY